jgi:hypothetical protein
VLSRFRRWLRMRRHLHEREPDLKDDDPDVIAGKRRLRASVRLVEREAARSARALRRLNRVLALRARAIDSIGTAESALASMDEAREHHDQ